MSLSWSMGPTTSWWHLLLISTIWSGVPRKEGLSSADKEGSMNTMVKKIFIIIIMVTVAIKITSPECFSRPTTSRDESKYSFSLQGVSKKRGISALSSSNPCIFAPIHPISEIFFLPESWCPEENWAVFELCRSSMTGNNQKRWSSSYPLNKSFHKEK